MENKQQNDFEMNSGAKDIVHGYEEALDLTGHGRYNVGLLFACFMVIIAMGIDIFGLGIIVTAATCDLGLNLQQIGVLSSMPFAGIIVMSYPWGYLSDTRGRRFVLMWALVGSFISAVLSSLSPTWQVLAALRFISSALSSAAESATYALLGECCISQHRARYMLLMTSALMLTPTLYYVWGYYITQLNFTFYIMGIAYRPWRLLTLVMAVPLGIGALLLYFFNESPKFLANIGKTKEAVDILKRMHKINGKNEKYPVKDIFLAEGSRETVAMTLQSLWCQLAPLFAPPLLKRTMLLYYLTFVIYIANNSFAIILPTIFNVFFTSYANIEGDASFCNLLDTNNTANMQEEEMLGSECSAGIEANTVLTGCAHGVGFFFSQCTAVAGCAQAEGAYNSYISDSGNSGHPGRLDGRAALRTGTVLYLPNNRHGVRHRIVLLRHALSYFLQGHGGMSRYDGRSSERLRGHQRGECRHLPALRRHAVWRRGTRVQWRRRRLVPALGHRTF